VSDRRVCTVSDSRILPKSSRSRHGVNAAAWGAPDGDLDAEGAEDAAGAGVGSSSASSRRLWFAGNAGTGADCYAAEPRMDSRP
jgi:hypothetical protein